MPRITLTDLIEVITKSGSPKATKVSQLKNRDAYDPATDFYRALREGIIQIHKSGGVKGDLAKIQKKLTDPKKIANYPAMIAGYRKWWGHKTLSWFEPQGATYAHAGIEVAINPELGLLINGQSHLVKLYLKSEALTKTKADLIVALMQHALSSHHGKTINFSVLDARNSKLFTYVPTGKVFKPMMDAELTYIASLWPHV